MLPVQTTPRPLRLELRASNNWAALLISPRLFSRFLRYDELKDTGCFRGGLIDETYRKLHNSRPRPTHSSNKPLSLLRPSLSSIRGSDMRDKSKSVNKRSSQKASFLRSKRNSRTPRFCNKSYSKVLLMLRVCDLPSFIFYVY